MTDETCWTLIEAAGAGDAHARDEFAARYLPAVRAYLGARWGSQALASEVEDAQQEVFVECLKEGGALERAERGARSGFRGYLYGVVRNVAGRVEDRRRRILDRATDQSFHADQNAADDASLSAVFDRAFAQGVLRAALLLHRTRSQAAGKPEAERFELLRLRFQEGLSIAAIAERQGGDAARLHHEYASARTEFHACLREVVASHNPGASAGEIDRGCQELVELIEK